MLFILQTHFYLTLEIHFIVSYSNISLPPPVKSYSEFPHNLTFHFMTVDIITSRATDPPNSIWHLHQTLQPFHVTHLLWDNIQPSTGRIWVSQIAFGQTRLCSDLPWSSISHDYFFNWICSNIKHFGWHSRGEVQCMGSFVQQVTTSTKLDCTALDNTSPYWTIPYIL